jgi:hypothetical protein
MEPLIVENRWNTPMKVMVIGHARHGKDTVGELLRKHYGLRFTSSSLFCAEKVMMPAFERLGAEMGGEGTPYASAEECFKYRHDHRVFWHEQINKYCEDDLSRLAREILAANDVYCGCRNDREFLQAKGEGLYDASLWVDASLRHKPEPRSSMKLEPWMADQVVDNNGTLEQLERNLVRIFNRIVVLRRASWRAERAGAL